MHAVWLCHRFGPIRHQKGLMTSVVFKSVIQIWKLLADFHETYQSRYVTGGDVTVAVFNLLHRLTTWRTLEFRAAGATLAPITSESWNNEFKKVHRWSRHSDDITVRGRVTATPVRATDFVFCRRTDEQWDSTGSFCDRGSAGHSHSPCILAWRKRGHRQLWSSSYSVIKYDLHKGPALVFTHPP